jgi:nucleotide-binding universal stress UspA family protein
MAWEYEIFGALPGDAVALPEEDKGPKMAEHLEGIVRAELGDYADEVELRPVYGSPSEALIDAALGADLVVLGTRGLGGFKRLLLGSVSTQVVHHAHVPVVVIPPDEPDEDE